VKRQFIEAAIHQSGNSAKRQFIKAAIHRSGNSSKRQFIKAAIHQMAFSSNAQAHLIFKTVSRIFTCVTYRPTKCVVPLSIVLINQCASRGQLVTLFPLKKKFMKVPKIKHRF
jgi:hypothetical protein